MASVRTCVMYLSAPGTRPRSKTQNPENCVRTSKSDCSASINISVVCKICDTAVSHLHWRNIMWTSMFVLDLMEFKENRRGSPDYTIYLCFGEKLPDGKPLQKKLIVVKVNITKCTIAKGVVLFLVCSSVIALHFFLLTQIVPMICHELHARAQINGASSLQNDNVSLQISHNSLFDLINSLGLPSMDMSLP